MNSRTTQQQHVSAPTRSAVSVEYIPGRLAQRPIKLTDVKTYVIATDPPHHGGLLWYFVKLE
ncbi:MAG TPA: hypothetical protein VMT83_14595, partial [Burkholderiaceae bacterium]|nr:hypothetical protein [Burkholderiaceae bacterium]